MGRLTRPLKDRMVSVRFDPFEDDFPALMRLALQHLVGKPHLLEGQHLPHGGFQGAGIQQRREAVQPFRRHLDQEKPGAHPIVPRLCPVRLGDRGDEDAPGLQDATGAHLGGSAHGIKDGIYPLHHVLEAR